ncbi:Nucleotidyl transferase AbiEii toxin, Type IV TA system [Tistlia consotensis]|uniref:Nucleotidyl transferase AbiEii toxin, Type IV TA system n=1 Tax=Tistlia consotensis USBA 355 TaxID=560819 RepID=A0A1Y6CQG7_9PROT|nr:nucleotidyl transferase AbiEii/AbiGii toxin family protein [Tistlia consotensis]SMF82098.1 Nucleotidyl transferase AbiEii toxin, Type IV TA system [Tistlia consotensis USBA 355]SNS25433.1 Nucleotidyl transferase AbiEii toxin, Type IV TA system [Tistlia consotensis]
MANSKPGWLQLLETAEEILERAQQDSGQGIDWTLGGGTAIALQLGHRLSHDVDLFLDRPEFLAALSPRINDAAAASTDRYREDARSLRLEYPAGEIDFIAAPRRLETLPPAARSIDGREVLVDHPAEVVAKKIAWRAQNFMARDVFDLAVVLEHCPEARALLLREAAAQLPRLEARLAVLRERPGVVGEAVSPLPGFESYVERAPTIVTEFLGEARRSIDPVQRPAPAGQSGRFDPARPESWWATGPLEEDDAQSAERERILLAARRLAPQALKDLHAALLPQADADYRAFKEGRISAAEAAPAVLAENALREVAGERGIALSSGRAAAARSAPSRKR